MAGKDQADRVLQVVAVPHEIVGEPFKQFGVARRMIEPKIVLGFEQAETEVAFPEPVNDGFGEAGIGRVN